MSETTPNGNLKGADVSEFDWPVAFEAEFLLRERIESFLRNNRFARELSERMRQETATDFFEWVDHISVPAQEEAVLREAGFVESSIKDLEGRVLEHPRATLPRIVIEEELAQSPGRIALKVESLADFVAANGIEEKIEGEPYSRLRRVIASRENGTVLEVCERNGYGGFSAASLSGEELRDIVRVKEAFRTRPRHPASESDGFRDANERLDDGVKRVGVALTCQIFFEEERRYWEGRNRAAQVQKRRQDRLGLGWANHDHHTYRCSRGHFIDVIEFLLRLNFQKRERYYAGAEAGWGAQICEQPEVGIVVFADVDLMPEEVEIDFSSKRLAAATRLGTVGLWTGLHGESFLEAGMHHLEARFDFDLLSEQLRNEGVETMKPFSDFKFLRQAFTAGECWPVRRARIDKLVKAGLITRAQAEKFAKEGAIGSHLENLQRRGGFKGFNQKSVSAIISATDPRKHLPAAGA